jgi:hypothetical protein
MLYTPIIHAVTFLDSLRHTVRVQIELIKHRFFSMNDKFYAIVDSLKVPVSNDYL